MTRLKEWACKINSCVHRFINKFQNKEGRLNLLGGTLFVAWKAVCVPFVFAYGAVQGVRLLLTDPKQLWFEICYRTWQLKEVGLAVAGIELGGSFWISPRAITFFYLTAIGLIFSPMAFYYWGPFGNMVFKTAPAILWLITGVRPAILRYRHTMREDYTVEVAAVMAHQEVVISRKRASNLYSAMDFGRKANDLAAGLDNVIRTSRRVTSDHGADTKKRLINKRRVEDGSPYPEIDKRIT